MSIFFHIKENPESGWSSDRRPWDRIPAVGELFSFGPLEPLYQVQLVVHPMFRSSECDAEVYAVKTTLEGALKGC